MKIFVWDRYAVFTFVLILIVALCVMPLSINQYSSVASINREIPIYNVDRSDKVVSITFDCAWNADDIDEIIAALKEYNCRATFFVVGDWAQKYSDAVKKLSNAGHEISNHSAKHDYYTKLSKEQMIKDMDACDKIIKDITGVNNKLFRAPYGDYNNNVVLAAKESGRYMIQWDVDSLDWKNLSVDEIVERVTSKVSNGSIVLMHNGTENTYKALPIILKILQDEGYSFLPTSEMIYYENYIIDHAGKQILKNN